MIKFEYIRTLKSLVADFIRDKQPEDVSYYQEVYDWLDSLPVESPDFEAEWKRYTASRKDDMRTNAVTMNVKEVAKHFAEWQKKQDDELLAIAHFDGVAAGREAERKELLEWARNEQKESTTILADDWWQKVIEKLQSE